MDAVARLEHDRCKCDHALAFLRGAGNDFGRSVTRTSTDRTLIRHGPTAIQHNANPGRSIKFAGGLYQIGVFLRDIEQGMTRYRELLGLGPFWRLDTHYEGRYRNWTGTFAKKTAFTRWEKLYCEMIEPGLGEGNAKEWLQTQGEGICHLGYATDDLSQRPGGGDPSRYGGAAWLFVELSDRVLVQRVNSAIDVFLLQACKKPGPTQGL